MPFFEDVQALAKTSLELKDDLQTEEAVKHSLIMPFLNLLGYNVFNPKEVVPEYIAEVGTKKGEKVDYAILHDGDPHIIIEIKGPGSKPEDHLNQLYRYFNALRKAKFAILTNGIVFQFYSDIDEPNILDKTPFLTIDLENLKEPAVAELEKFHKQKYDKEIILSTTNDLKYTTQIKEYLNQQFKKPDEDFLKFILRNIYSGKLMSSVLERFEPIVKKSMNLFINEIVSDKIKIALEGVKTEEVKESEKIIEDNKEEQEPDKKKDIITTEEELEAFFLVKFLLKDIIGDAHTIDYKDTLSYFAVMIDNNIRNWLCRFYFSEAIKKIMFNGEDKIVINSIKEEDLLLPPLKNNSLCSRASSPVRSCAL